MRKGIWLFLGGLLGLVLAACMARPEITPLPPSPMLPAVPTSEATLVSLKAPPVDNSTCIACHSNEEMLRALAKEPEKAEALSEGEG